MPRGAEYHSEEQKKRIAEAMEKHHQERGGWPANTQGRRWSPEALEECTWEWARLMMNSERGHW